MQTRKLVQGSVKAVSGLTCGVLGGWVLLSHGLRSNAYVVATCVGMLGSAAILLKQALNDVRGES